MNQTYVQLIEISNAVWKRRWKALSVAWVICLLGWLFVVSKPDFYTSSTRIFLDTASVLKPLLEGLAVERDSKIELEVMKQTLTTRASLEKVARKTDLDIFATNPVQMQRLLDGLKGRTTVNTEGAFLLVISYRDTDPVRARDVVQAIGETFIESNLGENRAEIEDAQIFLDRQIAEYERALRISEERLAKFKETELSTLPDQQNYLFRLEQMRAELSEAESDLQLARVQRGRLLKQVEQAPASEQAIEIVKAEQELKQMLTKFTQQHPDLLAQKRKIALLREEGNVSPSEEARARRALAGEASVSWEKYNDAQLKLGEVETLLAGHSERVRRLRSRIQKLRTSAARVPEVEVQLARLDRDYDILKNKHAEFISRREQAKISKDREVGAERVRYEIVDPPRIPAIPDGPSRSILMSLVLAVAVASGIGFVILLSYINSSFADPAQLRQAFGVNVLGTVSNIQSLTQQTWQVAKFSVFVASTLSLFGVYAVMMLMETRLGWKNVFSSELLEGIYNNAMSLLDMI
jgi:polysaccharide chain length determinant protein (PEP-CTERM system associated)